MSTVGEEYPKEQARLRKLIGQYRAIGPAGSFGAAMIEATLQEADQAAVAGDLPRMLAAFHAMQECK